MKAIKTKNTMKQLIGTFSMLLFLFTAGNLCGQEVAGIDPADMAANNIEAVPVRTPPPSPLGFDVLQSNPVKYDRNTLISYSIPKELNVEIKIYDKEGMELKTLFSGKQNKGTHNIDFNSAELKNGIYFYQLTVGPYSEIIKFILVN